MKTFLTSTQSICGVCKKPITAQLFEEAGSVWMHKECPEHGPQAARIYGDAAAYRKLPHFHRRASVPHAFTTEARGCPDSCGICPEHEQHVCLPIIEITNHCNWECPVCLVSNPGDRHLTRAQLAHILDRLIETEGQIDILNLSGGEPTLHPEFRELVQDCLARPQILRVSVSTNGSVLARNPDLLAFLAQNQVIISLQFDGFDDEVYRTLRGRPLLDEKLRIIEQCAQRDASMSLTMTVTRAVNDKDIGAVAKLLFSHEHILSAMFQPAAYAGAARSLGRPADAITTPDVIAALASTPGLPVTAEDFSPLPCSHPACFSLAFYLRNEDQSFTPVKQLVSAERHMDLIQNRAIFGTDAASFASITDAVYDLWSGPAALSPDSQKALRTIRHLLASITERGGFSPKKALSVAQRSMKSLFIHQFMDPDSFDLSRARKCCQVYPQPDGRMIPVCVHNCLKRGCQ